MNKQFTLITNLIRIINLLMIQPTVYVLYVYYQYIIQVLMRIAWTMNCNNWDNTLYTVMKGGIFVTRNQLEYWKLRELERSNKAREAENIRSNMASEGIRNIANVIARQNQVDALEVQERIQSEANAIRRETNVNQATANAIAAERVENEYLLGTWNYLVRRDQQTLQEDESFSRQVANYAPAVRIFASLIQSIFGTD